MSRKKSPPYDLKLIGKKYVFFTDILTQKGNPLLIQYGLHASSQLSKIGSLLQDGGEDYTKNNETHLYNISAYIKFISDMAASERAAEEAFLNQQLQALKQAGENDTASQLADLFSNSKQDPNDFLLTINKLLQDTKNFEINVTNALQRIKSISRNMDKLGSDAQQEIATSFDESYKTYKAILMEKFSKLFKEEQSKQTKSSTRFQEVENINKTLANRVNKAIDQIADSPNLSEIFKDYSEKGISVEKFKNIVINTIVDYVLKTNDQEFNKDCIKKIEDILKNMLSDLQQVAKLSESDYIQVFDKTDKKLKEIEIAAFEKDTSLSTIILEDLNDQSIQKLRDRYPETNNLITALFAAKDEGDPRKIQTAKSNLTRELRRIIQKQAEDEIGPISNYKNIQAYTEELRNQNFITEVALKNTLSSQLKAFSITHDGIAEVITSNDTKKRLAGVLWSETPGKVIKLKADVRFFIGYLNSDAQLIDGTPIQGIIDKTITQFGTDFLKQYQKQSKGSTDVSAAIEVYIQQLRAMKEYIDQIVKDKNLPDESKQQLYEALYETFAGSVSVKDYELYNNQLGVHGGALGPGKVPEGVIKNVTKMYETGGITAIDAEKILFAVLNCGEAMIGHYLKLPLETYLLGGAALIMFDEGFANSEAFLQSVAKELEGFRGQRTVHFYRVSTAYIPASYVLENIAKNLQVAYNEIATNVRTNRIENQNKVTIINNITEDVIPDPTNTTPQERWTAVSNKAQSEIQITFSFMAGLLDILENLSKAVNV